MMETLRLLQEIYLLEALTLGALIGGAILCLYLGVRTLLNEDDNDQDFYP